MRCYQTIVSWTVVAGAVLVGWALMTGAAQADQDKRETSIRAGSGRTIVAVKGLPRPPDARAARDLPDYPHPRPRLAGFAALIAIATSDEGDPYYGFGYEFKHGLESSYVGSSLNPSADPGFVIGFLDTGSDVDLAAGTYADILGLSGANLTEYTIAIGGVGGEITAQITEPLGFFAAGLSAIDENGDLDYGALVGHSNSSGLAAPAIDCGNGEVLSAVIGKSLLGFYNSVIRVDTPRTATVSGVTYLAPDVQILDPVYDPLPSFPRKIAMEISPLPPVTANYFYMDPPFDFFNTPTALSAVVGSIPTGGSFFATIYVVEGEPSPTNPVIPMRVLVDTGAQSSIMSSAMVANLSLPGTPDFSVDVCGVGGLVEDVPAYYVDYVKMNAENGPLHFSRAPFVVLDLMGPEGVILEGVLGMNFFWNRNVIFEPALEGIAFFHVSDPIPVAYGDSDVDFDVDAHDTQIFVSCITGPGAETLEPDCDHLDGDFDGDVDLADFGRFQQCHSGSGITADPDCGG